jgi:hypothetical protein
VPERLDADVELIKERVRDNSQHSAASQPKPAQPDPAE